MAYPEILFLYDSPSYLLGYACMKNPRKFRILLQRFDISMDDAIREYKSQIDEFDGELNEFIEIKQ
jgi:hypothetical protein